MNSESMARKTLWFEQFVDIFHEEGIEEGHGEFDVAEMARTEVHRHAAGHAGRLVVERRYAKGFRV